MADSGHCALVCVALLACALHPNTCTCIEQLKETRKLGVLSNRKHRYYQLKKWNPVSVLFDAWGLRQAVYLHSGIWEDFGFSEASPAPWGHFPISAYWNRWRLFHACLSNIRNHYKGSWREEHWCVYSWFMELFYIQASVVFCVVQCQQSVLISSVWDLGHQTQRRGSSVPTQLCVGFCLEIWTAFNCQLGKVTCFIPENKRILFKCFFLWFC